MTCQAGLQGVDLPKTSHKRCPNYWTVGAKSGSSADRPPGHPKHTPGLQGDWSGDSRKSSMLSTAHECPKAKQAQHDSDGINHVCLARFRVSWETKRRGPAKSTRNLPRERGDMFQNSQDSHGSGVVE